MHFLKRSPLRICNVVGVFDLHGLVGLAGLVGLVRLVGLVHTHNVPRIYCAKKRFRVSIVCCYRWSYPPSLRSTSHSQRAKYLLCEHNVLGIYCEKLPVAPQPTEALFQPMCFDSIGGSFRRLLGLGWAHTDLQRNPADGQ